MFAAVSPVLQSLDVPPLTDILIGEPGQIVVSLEIDVATYVCTVTVMLSVFEHLPLSLLVTVYLVVALGVTVIETVVSPVLQE